MSTTQKLRLKGLAKWMTIQHLYNQVGSVMDDDEKFYRYLLISNYFKPIMYSLSNIDRSIDGTRWSLCVNKESKPIDLSNEMVQKLYSLLGPLRLLNFVLSNRINEKKRYQAGMMDVLRLPGFFDNTTGFSFGNKSLPTAFYILQQVPNLPLKLSCDFDLIMHKNFSSFNFKFNELNLSRFRDFEKTDLKHIFRHDIKVLKLDLSYMNDFETFKWMSESDIKFKNLNTLIVEGHRLTDFTSNFLKTINAFHQHFPKLNKLHLKSNISLRVSNNERTLRDVFAIYKDILIFKDKTKGFLNELSIELRVNHDNRRNRLDLPALKSQLEKSNEFKEAQISLTEYTYDSWIDVAIKNRRIDNLTLDLKIFLQRDSYYDNHYNFDEEAFGGWALNVVAEDV